MTTERGQAARPGKPRRRSGNDGFCEWPHVMAFTAAAVAIFGVFAYAGYAIGLTGPAAGRPVFLLGASPSPVPNISTKSALISDAVQNHAQLAAIAPAILVSLKSDLLYEETPVLERGDKLTGFIVSPPIPKLEMGWQLGREGRRRIVAERKKYFSEQACLARAIYFEARSESELGQFAVAKVILNRVKDPLFPDTICDVVYQDADQSNSCQFSFACDRLSDNPRPGKAWDQAKRIAARAMAGENKVEVISTATYYHADYVRPKWSDTMTRLIQIGRHIFYTGS